MDKLEQLLRASRYALSILEGESAGQSMDSIADNLRHCLKQVSNTGIESKTRYSGSVKELLDLDVAIGWWSGADVKELKNMYDLDVPEDLIPEILSKFEGELNGGENLWDALRIIAEYKMEEAVEDYG